MTQEVVITGVVSIAALLSVVGLATGKAARVVTAACLALLLLALLYGWSSDAVHDLDKGVTVMAAILAVAGGGLVTTQVFAFVEDRERVQEASAVAERFIIGTFTSVLWAVACAGVAVLAP